MKDACHHLKHLQKKVIQASRKAEALESISHSHESPPTVPSKPSGGSSARKQTPSNQMRQDAIRNALH